MNNNVNTTRVVLILLFTLLKRLRKIKDAGTKIKTFILGGARTKIAYVRLLVLCMAAFCFPIPVSALAESQSQIPQSTMSTQSAALSESKPFTPAGTGTVMDNTTDADGKEFFTITTDDGNVFYLVIDRQRNDDNVYLLNAVTESDLLSLAKKDDNSDRNVSGSISAIPDPEPEVTPAQPTPEAEEPAERPNKEGNSGIFIFIIVILAVGGVGYYFKIYKPRQQADDMNDGDILEDDIPEEDIPEDEDPYDNKEDI